MEQDRHLKTVLDALSIYGENTRTALLAELKKQGVVFEHDRFDLTKFCFVLEQFLDGWADMVYVKITDDLCKATGQSLEDLGLWARAKLIGHSALFREVFVKIKTRN